MYGIFDSTFKLTPLGIHLTRKKFTYKVINYDEVVKANVIKGRSVKNWVLILTFGLLFLFFSTTIFYFLINSLFESQKNVRFYLVWGNGIIVFVLTGFIGIFSIKNALEVIPIIELVTAKKSYKLRLKNRKNDLKEILEYLRSKEIEVREE